MMERLTAVQRRFAALALTVALAGLGYGAFVLPLIEAHRYYDESIADLRHRLAQYQRVAKDREANQRLLDQRKRADLAKGHYLAERNPALASAELQALLKRAVEQGKGELVSTQVVSPQRGSEVTVKVRVRGSIRTLQKLLYALESSRPILFVNTLTVDAAPATRPARPEATPPANDLVIGIDVTGYTRERKT